MPIDDARMTQLLASNEVPTPSEMTAIQQEYEDRCNAARQLLLQFCNYTLPLRSSVLSPVRRVPAEILGQIFLRAVPERTGDANYRAALLDLCLVCKHWCNAARLTHGLWTDLAFIFPKCGAISLETVSTWFGRAGGSTYRKSLIFRPDQGPWGPNDALPSIEQQYQLGLHISKLMTEGPAIDHLTLDFSLIAIFDMFLQSINPPYQAQEATPANRPWDTITSLSLCFDNCSTNVSYIPSLSDLPRNIKKFELRLPSYFSMTTVDPTIIRLQPSPEILKNLTSLRLGTDWPYSRMEPILRLCVNLESLAVDFYIEGLNVDTTVLGPLPKSLRLPELQRIHISYATTSALQFLLTLDTPRLTHADVSFHDYGNCEEFLTSQNISDHWLPWLNNNPNIEAIAIRDVSIDYSVFLEMFSKPLRSLQSLTLDGVKVPPAALAALCTRDPSTGVPFYPRLEILKCLHAESDIDMGRVLLDFLNSPSVGDDLSGQSGWTEIAPPGTIKQCIVTYRKIVVREVPQMLYEGREGQLANLKTKGVNLEVGKRYSVQELHEPEDTFP